jgi:DNA-binding response OmpR family regulator
MHNLRHSLELDPSRPQRFLSEAGLGYRLRSNEIVQTQHGFAHQD